MTIHTEVDGTRGEVTMIDPISGNFRIEPVESHPYLRASVIDRLLDEGLAEGFK